MDGSGGAYCILGCSKGGKTHLTKALIRTYAKNFDSITILSGTSFSLDWVELGIEPEEISVARLERFQEVCSTQVKITGKKGRHLLICDDWIGKLSTRTSVISSICTAGRHSGITSLWLTQHMKALDLKIRTNICDWIVMGNQIPMVISGVSDISPMNKASFMAQYGKLVKYDFTYINTSDNKVVFSRRLRNNGFKLTPILSARDRVTAQIKAEASMHIRDEGRDGLEMRELRLYGRPSLQEAYGDEDDSSSSREPTREEAEEAEDRRNRRERARRGRDSSEVRTERESEESKPTPKKSDSGSLSGREKFEDKFARLRGFKIPPKQERITEAEDRGRGVRDGGDGGRKRTSRIQSSIL